MINELKEISKRIKGLRESENVSMESLANDLKVAFDTYKLYENGELDIPVGVLFQISHRFGVELTSLITGEEPKLHKYSIVRKDRAPLIERRKEYKYLDLSYNFINKKIETFLVLIEPQKDNKTNFYSHPGQEFNYVLEGSMKIILEDKEIVLDKGDSIYFDSSQKHAMYSLNNSPAQFIAVIVS